jgi:hypothetical protein
MNKRGQDLVQSESIEYILLVALAVTMTVMSTNALNTEKYNGVVAEDLSLALNSGTIPEGNIEFSYSFGDASRMINFEDGNFKTYIDDPIREKEGLLLLNNELDTNLESSGSKNLKFSKIDERVEVS